MSKDRDFIAVVDFGGQYAHLIAKRVRHNGVYSRIFAPTAELSQIDNAKGVILSGGPESVYGEEAVPFNTRLLEFDGPLLGLCYGHQLLTHHLGGEVRHLEHGEFGKTTLRIKPRAASPLLEGMPAESMVWMSHADTVVAPPPDFTVLASSEFCAVAAMAHRERPVFGLQFHPEVADTEQGSRIIANFVRLTGAAKTWNMAEFMREAMAECRQQVGERNVLMFLSGGVDSTVAFKLLTQSLGNERVKGLLIDNGFLRLGEAKQIMERYQGLGFDNVDHLDASADFLTALEGLTDPQQKRVAVGEMFVEVRDRYLAGLRLDPEQWLLGQGTLYPDIIESGGTEHAQVIKSHHNRVEMIQQLIARGHVVEPLRELYKDEVRNLGMELGLPDAIVWRHPFPGPGLSINVLCADGTETYPEIESSQLPLEALLAETGYAGVLLPVRSVGVQGDSRTYAPPAALCGPRDWEALERCSTLITNSLRAVNRVVTLLAPAALPPLSAHQAYCTADRLDLLREADHLATDMLEREGLMREVFQLLVILLPLAAGERGECVVLRPVVSEDVMTARFARLPWPLLERLAGEILALPDVDAVFYDVTNKPPATFGWE
jgi:GMP synthase (glutamine-hydrolysing)